MTRAPIQSRRGMAMIEAVVSLIVVSVMMVAALNAVGASKVGQRWSSDKLRATYLASDLMAEICDSAYSDPNETPIIGIELSEILSGRAAFDDVDDYNGLTETPPGTRAGAALPGLTNWSRTVAVVFIDPSNPAVVSIGDTGAQRITVTVKRGGLPLATLIAIRTAASAR